MAQIATPGEAMAVACAGDRVAVAAGSAGLTIVDIADPPASEIVHEVPLEGIARAVEIVGKTVWVGTTAAPQLVGVDIDTGDVVESRQLGAAVFDFAVAGDFLFVLTAGELLTFRLIGGLSGEVDSSGFAPFEKPVASGVRARLFVGGDVAFASHLSGFDTFDISDPLAPRLIADGDVGVAGWRHIVSNGTGLGVAAAGPNATGDRSVLLYDVDDPAITDSFLLQIDTPGAATSVEIFNGRAYVADGEAGLQVVNYLALERSGAAPLIDVEVNFAPGFAEEGQTLRATANVTDDVQVRESGVLHRRRSHGRRR